MRGVHCRMSVRVAHLFGKDLRCGGHVSGARRDRRPPKFEEPAGAVVWYGAWSSICIFFDICEPYGTCNMFARICEADRERFAAACRALWDDQGAPIRNEIVDVEEEEA